MESISLKANPKANPVNPNPATIAETFTPSVPNTVIIPTITIIFFTILDNTFEIALFEFLLSNILSIARYTTFENIKNINNIRIDEIILGT